jgi:hypothetical protein
VEASLVPAFKYLIDLAEFAYGEVQFVGLQIARHNQEHYGMNL